MFTANSAALHERFGSRHTESVDGDLGQDSGIPTKLLDLLRSPGDGGRGVGGLRCWLPISHVDDSSPGRHADNSHCAAAVAAKNFQCRHGHDLVFKKAGDLGAEPVFRLLPVAGDEIQGHLDNRIAPVRNVQDLEAMLIGPAS